MGMIVHHGGKQYDLPFDINWPRSMTAQLPNAVTLQIDEYDFKRRFGDHAEWVEGSGPYATLAYCGGKLTIARWSTLEKAISAKRAIDGGGCGGGCCKVHLIAHIDPENGHAAREAAWIERVIAEQDLKPMNLHPHEPAPGIYTGP